MSSKRSRLQCLEVLKDHLLVAAVLLAAAMATDPALAVIEGTKWYRLGPAPTHGFFGGGATGRATAIAVNPYNTDHIWIGSATGGAWFSHDGGLTWGPRSCDEPVGSIALADCDETGCDTVYVGSGENAIRRDTYYGFGVLRGDLSSSAPDPVNTIPSCTPFPKWELLAGDPYDFHHGSINDIVVIEPADPEGDDTLLVALSSGLTTSSSQATNTAPEPSGGYGIYRSVDGGAVWEKLDVPPGPEEARPSDLEIDPTDSDVLYAGFIGKGVFKSTDGGDTWCPLNDGITLPPDCPDAVNLPDVTTYEFDHVEIALFPGDSDILYASFGRCADPLLQNCVPSIHISEDGGLSWLNPQSGNPVQGSNYGAGRVFSRYTHALAVHPVDSDTIFLGGVKLWKSTNKGATFVASDTNTSPFCSQWGCVLHFDYREILFHPADDDLMYVTNDGGVAYSTDGGENWTTGNDTLQITGFYSIASSPLTPRVIGASQDNAGQLYDGHIAWDHLACCGDGGFSVMDLDDPLRMYIVQNHGEVMRSVNGGYGWSSKAIPLAEQYQRLFSAPLVQDPTLDVESDNHPLYFGGDLLWRSVNDGSDWTEVSPVLAYGNYPEIVTAPTKTSHVNSPGGGVNVITAIAVAPSDPGRIYVGYYGGEIFVTDSPCADPSCWSDDMSEGLPDVPVTRIAVHPEDPDTAFAAFSGFGTSAHVWKTVDGGENWIPAASGLPEGVPVNTISIEPLPPMNLWAGLDGNLTGESLYKSTDGGDSWDPWNELGFLPNAPVYEISVDQAHGRIYAATHGRGAYVLGNPFLITASDCDSDAQIQNLVVSGPNFLPNQHDCVMMLFQTKSTDSTEALCSKDPDTWAMHFRDAKNNEIRTDSTGALVAGYTEQAYACFEGECINGVPIEDCNDDADDDGIPDPLTTVRVACPLTPNGSGDVAACVESSSFLPSAQLWVGFSRYVPSPGGDTFSLTPCVHSPGDTRSLCTVTVPYGPGETAGDVLTRARDAIDAGRTCTANLADAELVGDPGENEDDFPHDPALSIESGGIGGIDILTAVHALPGKGTGTCYELDKLGVPVTGQLQAMRLEFVTTGAGAAGGSIDIGERSGIGTCYITVETLPGQTATQIARAVESAFQDPAVPSPHPYCPVERNPRDVIADGDSVGIVVAKAIDICINDTGVGFNLRPKGIPNVHPAAVAGADQQVECTSPLGATVVLDGSASSDPDSTPGTDDDIALYEWFEDYGETGGTPLGTGETLPIRFPLGSHAVTLRVTDLAGLASLDDVSIAVVDTTPPAISAVVTPDILWPPNHRMVDVAAVVDSSDICSTPTVALASAASDEADDAPGDGDGNTTNDIQDVAIGTADFAYRLRAERNGAGDGRTYTITYSATDGAGNQAPAASVVNVPRDQNGLTEPVQLTVEENARGTVVRWGPVTGARWYNVIRGYRSGIRETAAAYDLGAVLCVEAASTDDNTIGNEDTGLPASGEAFFYLVEYDDGSRTGYGTESAAKPLAAGSGDCP